MAFWRKKKEITVNNHGQFKDDGVFCAMPWVHLHVTQNGNITPCCQAPWGDEAKLGDINTSTIQEIWKGKPFEDFRKQMLKGKPAPACTRCYEKEELGWISLREITNDKYENEINDLILKEFHSSSYETPVYFDIRFSNVCNLKCRICNFSSSSSWYNDDLALGNIKPETPALTTSIIDEEKFFNDFKEQIGSIKEIYFAGGEPLMMDQHYQILEFLFETGNTKCKLFYNTNLSRLTFKQFSVLELWKQFESVNLAVSLDDIGDRLEYQRKNAKWEQMVSNFEAIKQDAPNVDLMISPTISVFNILSITEMHKTLFEKGYVRVEDVVPTLLVYPMEFNIRSLTKELKGIAEGRILDHLIWLESKMVEDWKKMDYVLRQYRNIITYLNNDGDEKARLNFPQKIAQLDALRDEDFIGVFPELKSMIH